LAEISAAAPGRVNLIGEHTDYNGGYVLPTTLPQQTHVVLTHRADSTVLVSSDLGSAAYLLGEESRLGGWIDYVQGVTWSLRHNGFPVSGFDITVRSDVPIGRGLSSSAALEVAVLRALRQAFEFELSDVELAMAAHKAETEFVGAPVGIMDQMVCSLGGSNAALFLDAMTREFKRVPLPAEVAIGVIDSGISHHHVSGAYRIRRRECDDAAAQLGVGLLREVTVADLARIERLPEPLNRRARHVVTENARVLAAVEALKQSDVKRLGSLFLESHASMRDDFEVSIPDIDRLVEIARQEDSVHGARLTGGGFGGAIVVLAEREEAKETMQRIAKEYQRATGQNGSVLLP